MFTVGDGAVSFVERDGSGQEIKTCTTADLSVVTDSQDSAATLSCSKGKYSANFAFTVAGGYRLHVEASVNETLSMMGPVLHILMKPSYVVHASFENKTMNKYVRRVCGQRKVVAHKLPLSKLRAIVDVDNEYVVQLVDKYGNQVPCPLARKEVVEVALFSVSKCRKSLCLLVCSLKQRQQSSLDEYFGFFECFGDINLISIVPEFAVSYDLLFKTRYSSSFFKVIAVGMYRKASFNDAGFYSQIFCLKCSRESLCIYILSPFFIFLIYFFLECLRADDAQCSNNGRCIFDVEETKATAKNFEEHSCLCEQGWAGQICEIGEQRSATNPKQRRIQYNYDKKKGNILFTVTLVFANDGLRCDFVVC